MSRSISSSFFLCWLVLVGHLEVLAQAEKSSAKFVEAIAASGDGAYSLLRRFDLPTDACHINKFRELNGLSAKQNLSRGKIYLLPVLEYDYDGKSIRTTLGMTDLDLAKNIQAYNRSREEAAHQSEPYEKSKRLWVPFGLIFCPDSARPSSPLAPAEAVGLESSTAESASMSNASGYDIFGPKYRDVPRIDQRLAGHHYYLIAGHGGPDPGAMASVNGKRICEDEYAYDVVLRLARNIIQHGGTAYVIVRDPDDGIRDDTYLECDYDEVAWGGEVIPRDQLLRLSQRTNAVNALAKQAKSKGAKVQYCIEIHVDSRHAERQTDLYFYHQKKSDKSEDLAEDIRDAMARNYLKNGRSRKYEGTIKSRELYTLRETDIPTVYIELGNIQHDFDQQRVLKVGNRQALADWFVEGILDATK